MNPGQSLDKIQEQIKTGKYTIVQLVEYYLQKIEDSKHLNAYLEIFEDEALEKAQNLDRKLKENPQSCGKAIGAIISIKDVICYKDHKVSASSKILAGFESLYSATAVQRVLDEDAIIIGRTNCDEFAMGSGNENSAFGPVINGIGKNRVPGGSSGGAAVSVQMNTCVAALGSETGGSIRQPAAFTGILGFKPSYGRVSRYGLIAYGSSFDQIGVFSKNVKTIAAFLEIIAGNDPFDATSTTIKVDNYSKLQNLGPQKIAYIEDALTHPSISPAIKTATLKTIESLKKQGHQLSPVKFKYLDAVVATYYVLTTAEASSNLGRFDGIRYGHRSKNAKDIHELYIKSRSEGFGDEVKRRIMMGSFVLSVGFYDAYFTKAQKVRKLIKQELEEIFNTFAFVLMPTTPNVAWQLNETSADPLKEYLADIFTVIANLAGIPAISFPVQYTDNGLPIGMQLMAPKFKERHLLSFISSVT
ncbi:MAG: Asp-tRNA(Asn)/Glu-tRNA(Gln) amidotransferase subunit GatA [Saprospiraceae bacterium]